MGQPPRKKVKIAYRRMQVSELYLKGWPQVLIATELGVSQSLISSDLKAIQKGWKESGIRDFDEAREKEFKKLDVLEREAWAAFTQSMQPAETTRATQQNGQIKAEKTIRERTGDPRYLQIVMKVIEMRCKLLGLDTVASTGGEHPDEESIRKEIYREFWGNSSKNSQVIDVAYIERIVAESTGSREDATDDLEALEAGTGTAG